MEGVQGFARREEFIQAVSQRLNERGFIFQDLKYGVTADRIFDQLNAVIQSTGKAFVSQSGRSALHQELIIKKGGTSATAT
eukprot:2671136-Pyramimonas_sp.AAC.1